MKVGITILKFLFIGALFIISNHQLYLSHQEDFNTFTRMYYSWLSNLFDHAFRIGGYVFNSEWLPKNNTQSIQTQDVIDFVG